MGEQSVDFVREVLSSCVTEFFDAYGVSCIVDDEADSAVGEHVLLGSIIGFRGKGVRGGLAFVAPVELITAILPVPLKDGEGQLRDWSAEIANQLVGRFKNKLSARSVDFDVGMPVCFTGKSIRFVFLPNAEGTSLSFHTPSSQVRVHLDCSLASELVDGEVGDLRIVPEGDLLLF
jgi:CheY-specific phosphatase CheX